MGMFELGGALAPALPELPVGPWTLAAADIPAFDAGAEKPPSLWRVDLASNDAASRAALAGGERSVARTHAVLDDVPRRLDQALGQAVAELARTARPEPLRGDLGQAPVSALPRAESSLLAALRHAEPLVSSRPDASPRPASPGVPGLSAQAPGQLERALLRAIDLALGHARIETHLAGALVACSVTTLSGDTELWVAPGLSVAGGRLHTRSVGLAVRTRHAWARVLALVVACCGRIMTLGLPAASLSALPLVWRFLRDVLSEVRERG